MIKDSGTRKEFTTGAVRDIQEGKGRCDLLPLDVVAELRHDDILRRIHRFTQDGDVCWLYEVLALSNDMFGDYATMLLEASKHFEEGCEKYGPNNWRKGIDAYCYINSGVRHYLKYQRGDTDERHDRAFVWNVMCCIWTCQNKPELNTYRKEGA